MTATQSQPVTQRDAGAGSWTARLRGASFTCLAIYLGSRMAVLFGAAAYHVYGRGVTWRSMVTNLDAYFYTHIAQVGYGHTLQPTGVSARHARFSNWAFYPGYPLAVRLVHEVTRQPYVASSVIASAVIGFFAIRAMWALGSAFGGREVAFGAATLLALWPGSVLFSMAYSEGLYVAAAAASLAATLRRRWLAAGAFGAVATLTRAFGLAVVVAVAVAAVEEWRSRRGERGVPWRALAAPVLAASGMVGFYLFGWVETGDPLIWRRAEDEWGQKFDFGRAMFRWIHTSLHLGGLRGIAAILYVVGGALLVLFIVAAVRLRGRARLPLVAYTVVATVMVVGYGNVGTRPRMVMAIVPGFVWLAAWLRGRALGVLAAAFASLLPLVAFFYAHWMRV